MTVLIIGSVILAVVALLLLSPAKVYVSYKGDGGGILTVSAGVGFIKFTFYDTSKEKINKEVEEEAKDVEHEFIKHPKIFLEDVKKYFNEVFDVISFLKKRMIIYNFKFYIRFGTGDAASTGILTGAAWAVLYDILAVCDNNFVLKKHDIKVAPDFLKEILLIDFETVIGIKVIYGLIIARKFLVPKGRREKNNEQPSYF